MAWTQAESAPARKNPWTRAVRPVLTEEVDMNKYYLIFS
jgi:hypothetical protein